MKKQTLADVILKQLALSIVVAAKSQADAKQQSSKFRTEFHRDQKVALLRVIKGLRDRPEWLKIKPSLKAQFHYWI